MHNLQTAFQESPAHTEYPRMQLVRESFYCLNGTWQYAITSSEDYPVQWDGTIQVPFSPEADLSGVKRSIEPKMYVHYFRQVVLPKGFMKDRLLLHFGAVDQQCEVFIDGVSVGSHDNGFLPFELDITSYQKGEVFDLWVRVSDETDASETLLGKQRRQHGGIWYTPQSGIWQTVWLESVPENYVARIDYIPAIDTGEITMELTVKGTLQDACYTITTPDGESIQGAFEETGKTTVILKDVARWSPEHPVLYDVCIQAGEDRLTSYFAMRQYGMKCIDGVWRFMLNNKPYFMNGVLDQGYYPDGLLTAPSDKAWQFDIKRMKELGFNTLRKHIKIEPLRFYYHCDRLGMLVWQDMINGGTQYDFYTTVLCQFTGKHISDGRKHFAKFGRRSEAEMTSFKGQLDEMIMLLRACPCIAVWVPFNEGWGQFEANEAVKRIRNLDTTRLIDHASGWHDQGGGDFKSYHIYFRPFRLKKPSERIIALTEYGGFSHALATHRYSDKVFGYKVFKRKADLCEAYKKLFYRDVIGNIEKGLSAAIYTQLSDVEEEVNGLLTYDRKVLKFDRELVVRLNRVVQETFERTVGDGETGEY